MRLTCKIIIIIIIIISEALASIRIGALNPRSANEGTRLFGGYACYYAEVHWPCVLHNTVLCTSKYCHSDNWIYRVACSPTQRPVFVGPGPRAEGSQGLGSGLLALGAKPRAQGPRSHALMDQHPRASGAQDPSLRSRAPKY